eukprot:6172133-Pleurochrysis_carterae.AAC.2
MLTAKSFIRLAGDFPRILILEIDYYTAQLLRLVLQHTDPQSLRGSCPALIFLRLNTELSLWRREA